MFFVEQTCKTLLFVKYNVYIFLKKDDIAIFIVVKIVYIYIIKITITHVIQTLTLLFTN